MTTDYKAIVEALQAQVAALTASNNAKDLEMERLANENAGRSRDMETRISANAGTITINGGGIVGFGKWFHASEAVYLLSAVDEAQPEYRQIDKMADKMAEILQQWPNDNSWKGAGNEGLCWNKGMKKAWNASAEGKAWKASKDAKYAKKGDKQQIDIND